MSRYRSAGRTWPWCLAALMLGSTACSSQAPEAPRLGTPEIRIPEAGEWIDRGPIFQAGSEGAWDRFLWGGFTATAVRLGNEYLLYYQGSPRFREDFDPTVCDRSIGLAHGDRAESLRKYGNAPVLTWQPNEGCEEGAVAGAALVDEGEVLVYYGANTLTGRTTVSADIRLARSTDGRTFRDVGVALPHDRAGVWGGGDELFPVLGFIDGPHSVVYYVPNGTRFARQLGVAFGPVPDRLGDTRRVLDPRGRPVTVWGPAGYGRVGPSLVALFLKGGPEADIEVRLADPSAPDRVSDPVRVYSFNGVNQATVMLDEELGSWLMFYRGDDFYGLKTAPVVPSGAGTGGPGR